LLLLVLLLLFWPKEPEADLGGALKGERARRAKVGLAVRAEGLRKRAEEEGAVEGLSGREWLNRLAAGRRGGGLVGRWRMGAAERGAT
jgi:hypothetical protein